MEIRRTNSTRGDSQDFNKDFEFRNGDITFSRRNSVNLLKSLDNSDFYNASVNIASKGCKSTKGCRIRLLIKDKSAYCQKITGSLPTPKYTRKFTDIKVKSKNFTYTEQIKIRFKNKYLCKFAIIHKKGYPHNRNQIERSVDDVEDSNKLERKYKQRIIKSFKVFSEEIVYFFVGKNKSAGKICEKKKYNNIRNCRVFVM